MARLDAESLMSATPSLLLVRAELWRYALEKVTISITVVSRVSTHGHFIITHYICSGGRLPGREIACINIVVFSLTPSNLVRGHLPRILRY